MSDRTTTPYMRVYMDGYRLGGYTEQIGPLTEQYPEVMRHALTDAAEGAYPGRAQHSPGVLNGIFDNTADSGLHALASSGGSIRQLLVAVGMGAEPEAGVATFAGTFRQLNYQMAGEGIVAATLPFAPGWDASASVLGDKCFGKLLHADAEEDDVNTAVGIDDLGAAGTTLFGGYMAYQILAGDGTATIKTQHAATNLDGSFGDLTGATSGSIDCSNPRAGLVATALNETVQRYLRWQIVLGTATAVTFLLAFARRFRP